MSSKTVAMYMKKAIAALEELSEDRLKVALDFIEYLKDKEEWEATWEVMADPETMEALREADEDRKAGRMDRFTPLEEVVQRVQNRTKPSSRKESSGT